MTATLGLALVIMIIGLIGSIAPLVPGPPIVWLGALFYAIQTDYREVGVVTLVVLAILAIVGGTSDWWLAYLGARQSGASGWATLASMVGGIVGFFVANIPGMIIGSLAAVVLVEFARHRDWRRVLRAGGGYLAGWLLSTVVEVGVSILMIVVFLLIVRP